jgi:hypothetical protein
MITTATNITSGNTASYYLQDDTGGVNLFVTGGSSFRPHIGDIVTAIGFLSSFSGSLELEADLTGATPARNATMVGILSNNFANYPAPKILAWDNLFRGPTNANLQYNYAGSVVLLTNIYLTNNGPLFLTGATNKFVGVTNASGQRSTLVFYLQQDQDLRPRTLPTFLYAAQGFLLPSSFGYEVGITRWSDVIAPPLTVKATHSIADSSSTITWQAIPLINSYSVLAATNVEGPWLPIATGLTFTNSTFGTNIDTDAGADQKFYRLSTP